MTLFCHAVVWCIKTQRRGNLLKSGWARPKIIQAIKKCSIKEKQRSKCPSSTPGSYATVIYCMLGEIFATTTTLRKKEDEPYMENLRNVDASFDYVNISELDKVVVT